MEGRVERGTRELDEGLKYMSMASAFHGNENLFVPTKQQVKKKKVYIPEGNNSWYFHPHPCLEIVHTHALSELHFNSPFAIPIYQTSGAD